ncbi:YcbK family protein [Inediibacterium massiliense]|uniref:YcbK family protein n=1 Tax=Inediibacterium massiliense TaxID=1658111 RepID=UPI0006B51746|nr:D-Ala-D-Ala carboxypeptidase family metallohydrolase [Inediibacterium massiliense]
MNNVYISKNFKLKEFECRDGSHLVKVDEKLIILLQILRDRVQKPIIITSGFRTEKYNQRVGGAKKSQHLLGRAADIKVPGVYPDEVAKIAKEIGFKGIGVYKNFTHVDVREGNMAFWRG